MNLKRSYIAWFIRKLQKEIRYNSLTTWILFSNLSNKSLILFNNLSSFSVNTNVIRCSGNVLLYGTAVVAAV